MSKISVIVPVYNVEAYVAQCLESIASQTFQDLEVIIVDDCGSDNSMTVVQAFLDNYTGPVSFKLLHHEHNKGLSAARNTGIDQASGEYISFIDSDDYISPNMYETLYHAIEEQGEEYRIISCCCYSDKDGILGKFLWEFDGPRTIEPSMFAEKMLLMTIPNTAWGKLYHRDIFSSVRFREGITNEDYMFHADLIDVIESKAYRTLVIPDKLYHYRIRGNSITNSLTTPFITAEIDNLNLVSASIKASKPELYNKLNYLKNRKIANFVIDNRKFSSQYHNALPALMSQYKSIKLSDARMMFSSKRVFIFLLIKLLAPLYCI